MKKIQNICIALALVAICFSGCLGENEDSDKNTAPGCINYDASTGRYC